jgi:hypothetical protein
MARNLPLTPQFSPTARPRTDLRGRRPDDSEAAPSDAGNAARGIAVSGRGRMAESVVQCQPAASRR